ncbi:hypothetical protein RRG08_021331 [Elysia crispata]|uniref:Uncharacterized protein n=1 Tax=Elysia crispata TaxID=231223 RepID=A0AAE1CLN7_9GAST|nr:hypothetical protein RRG08_021331 [Elysia crispata]
MFVVTTNLSAGNKRPPPWTGRRSLSVARLGRHHCAGIRGKCRLLRAKMAEENKSPDTDVLTEEEKLALAAIKEKFGGRWKEIRSENVDGFFSEMGVNFFLRKLISMARPEMELVVEESSIKISIKLPGKTDISILKLNKETENTNQQGKFKTIASYENDNLVSKATPCPGTSGKPVKVTREINPEGELQTTFQVNDVPLVKKSFPPLSPPPRRCESQILPELFRVDNSCSHWSRNPSRPSPHPLDAVSLRYSLNCSGWTIPVATGQEILPAPLPTPSTLVDNSCSHWSRNPSRPSPHPLDAVSLRYSLNCSGWTIPVATGQEILPAPLPTPSTL